MTPERLNVTSRQLAEFCQRHRIRRLAVFGSVLREDFGPGSDIDILVEFEPDVRLGLEFFDNQGELATLLGRPVDLLTADSIRPACSSEFFSSAEDLYVAA